MRIALSSLFAFTIACGSSSSAVTGQALGAATDDGQQLATAPLDAGPERSCRCATVTIECQGGGSAHARTDRATCTLELPAKACEVLGVAAGSKMDPLDVMALEAPSDLDDDAIYELCTAKHEARHACDDARVPVCQGEVEAYDVSLDCMRGFVADEKLALNIEGTLAAREVNACLCAGTACSDCIARCRADHPANGATCTQAQAVYCTAGP